MGLFNAIDSSDVDRLTAALVEGRRVELPYRRTASGEVKARVEIEAQGTGFCAGETKRSRPAGGTSGGS